MAIRLIGLTGGIGSGKTTVADAFGRLGAAVIDTDAIAHALTAPHGAAIGPIRAAFGTRAIAPDGRLDRAWMRARVFGDPAERVRLEAILHPMIRAEVERQIEAAEHSGAPYALLVVPLLIESGGWVGRVERVLVVDCDEATQVERVMRRNGLAREQVQAILAAQATRGERLAHADDVIDNGGDPAGLPARVAALHARYGPPGPTG